AHPARSDVAHGNHRVERAHLPDRAPAWQHPLSERERSRSAAKALYWGERSGSRRHPRMKPGGLPAGNAKVGYSMDLPARTSPVGQPVALYVTCLVDYLFPGVGIASVRLLEHLGLTVTFPFAQTCCGQPAYNGGYHREARPLAERFLDVFRDVPVIVCPSGSCTTMIRVEYPRLFADDPIRAEQARAIAARTWELTEFL